MTYTHPQCGTPCAEPELQARSGQPVTVIRTITEPDETHDSEMLPMYAIQFADGFESEAFSDELVERT